MTANITPTDHEPVDVDTLRTGITAAIVATAPGAATWSDGIVTVTVTGASRVYHAWPQTLARVTLTTPNGAETVIEGDDVASWDDLHARVVELGQAWATATGWDLGRVQALHHRLGQIERQASQARAQRDDAIRAAVAAGVTMYRIAQVTRLSQTAVGKIARGA